MKKELTIKQQIKYLPLEIIDENIIIYIPEYNVLLQYLKDESFIIKESNNESIKVSLCEISFIKRDRSIKKLILFLKYCINKLVDETIFTKGKLKYF